MKWKNSKISNVEILSKAGQLCRINPGGSVVIKSNGKAIGFKKYKDGSIEFPTKPGTKYSLQIN
jgi:hypothetical protein